MIYKDKHGNEIKAGMKIRHNNGEVEEVFACGDDDLGIRATTKQWEETHPDSELNGQCYPLYQFNLKEWEIIEA